MGGVSRNGTLANTTRASRVLSGTATGFALAVTVLMALAGSSAALTPHPPIVVSAPYKGTLPVPSENTQSTGCAVAKAGSPRWMPSTGAIHESIRSSSNACKYNGNYGGGGSSQASNDMTLLVPFKVGSNGNHTISSRWIVNLASVTSVTTGGCPPKSVNYNPPLYAYSFGGCSSSMSIFWQVNTQVVDLSNSSWFYTNGSYVAANNQSYWSNQTTCYNYGVPTCSNSTYGYNSSSAFGYGGIGYGTFTWNGATTLTLWSNSSYMVKTDHFALLVDIYMGVSTQAQQNQLVSPWAGGAFASINMASLGNGAVLNSITIA
jgi:hypothetical protein